MNNSTNPRDERWNARYNQIPALVDSAYMKFFKDDFESHLKEAKTNIDRKFKLLNSKDLAEIPPLKWVVRGVMPSSGLGAIYGPSGSGKSFLALDMCAAISEGAAWFGHRVEQTPVIYVALEGEGGMKLRVQPKG
jgi:Cdc6-like AAA superfamily ATPase